MQQKSSQENKDFALHHTFLMKKYFCMYSLLTDALRMSLAPSFIPRRDKISTLCDPVFALLDAEVAGIYSCIARVANRKNINFNFTR